MLKSLFVVIYIKQSAGKIISISKYELSFEFVFVCVCV